MFMLCLCNHATVFTILKEIERVQSNTSKLHFYQILHLENIYFDKENILRVTI